MTQKEFEALLPALETIPDSKLKNPHNPIAIELQDAENLFQWCQSDKDELTGTGLDWSIVESLPLKTAACRYAEKVWQEYLKSKKERGQYWQKRKKEGFDLRTYMVHAFAYAYRNPSSYNFKASYFRKSKTIAGMVQNLNDLAVVGRYHPEPLEKINFDMSLLEVAAEWSSELLKLYAQIISERSSKNELKKQRNRAFYHMMEAVKAIREHGQFAFWRNPERRKGYISSYRKLH